MVDRIKDAVDESLWEEQAAEAGFRKEDLSLIKSTLSDKSSKSHRMAKAGHDQLHRLPQNL